ncbi:unnamed protein product, partial [Amoebophrya sp. A25]|eukprot:GSA25T00017021001.1
MIKFKMFGGFARLMLVPIFLPGLPFPSSFSLPSAVYASSSTVRSSPANKASHSRNTKRKKGTTRSRTQERSSSSRLLQHRVAREQDDDSKRTASKDRAASTSDPVGVVDGAEAGAEEPWKPRLSPPLLAQH